MAKGGYLVTITSAAENDFVYGLVSGDAQFWWTDRFNNGIGPWLGGYQSDKSAEPAGNWRWTTSESWSYTNWAVGEPSNGSGTEDYLQFFGHLSSTGSTWNDYPVGGLVLGYIVEYDVP